MIHVALYQTAWVWGYDTCTLVCMTVCFSARVNEQSTAGRVYSELLSYIKVCVCVPVWMQMCGEKELLLWVCVLLPCVPLGTTSLPSPRCPSVASSWQSSSLAFFLAVSSSIPSPFCPWLWIWCSSLFFSFCNWYTVHCRRPISAFECKVLWGGVHSESEWVSEWVWDGTCSWTSCVLSSWNSWQSLLLRAGLTYSHSPRMPWVYDRQTDRQTERMIDWLMV